MVIGTANPFMGTQLWRTSLTKADPMAQFTDVDENSWSYPGIRYCVENGLMSGIGNGLFAPQMTTTRAQMVQILYNLAGDPEVSGTTPFTDLTDDWYRHERDDLRAERPRDARAGGGAAHGLCREDRAGRSVRRAG